MKTRADINQPSCRYKSINIVLNDTVRGQYIYQTKKKTSDVLVGGVLIINTSLYKR